MSTAAPLQNAKPQQSGNSGNAGLLLQRKCVCGLPTPSLTGVCEECGSGKRLQAKLTVGASNDPLEQEADRVAELALAAPLNSDVSVAPPRIQRVSDQSTGQMDTAPASVDRVLASSGRPLESALRRDMEKRFGHDFSRVRVHSGGAAEQSTRDVSADAYTVGHNVVFGVGKFAPWTSQGRRLIAHELAHVMQQNGGSQAKLKNGDHKSQTESEADHTPSYVGFQPPISKQTAGSNGVLARAPAPKAPVIGSKFVHPTGVASKFKGVNAKFDGRDFTVNDGAAAIMTQPAQSGKPISVRTVDATSCGGSISDSYANNPLYVGIKDFGAIPEGDFTVSLSEFSTFTASEQASMITGGMFTDPFGSSLHGGDWGAGRAPLHPKSLLPAPKPGCGETGKRSGFYLHGGSLPGSSGCIDVNNSGVTTFLSLLAGYKAAIPVKVSYKYPAPIIGSGKRALGRFTYPTKDGKPIKDPSIWDRFGAIVGSDDSPAPKTPEKETKSPPKLKPKAKPRPKPMPTPRPKPGEKGSGKKSVLLSPNSEELFAGDIHDDEFSDLLFDGDKERDDALV